jgi:hypothetical protein
MKWIFATRASAQQIVLAEVALELISVQDSVLSLITVHIMT